MSDGGIGCIYGREHEFISIHSHDRDIPTCRYCYYTPHKPPRRRKSNKRPKTLRGASLVLRAHMEDICAYCGCALSEKTRTVDHVVPRSRGGEDHLSNYVLACVECNTMKGNQTVEEWLGVNGPPHLLYRTSCDVM